MNRGDPNNEAEEEEEMIVDFPTWITQMIVGCLPLVVQLRELSKWMTLMYCAIVVFGMGTKEIVLLCVSTNAVVFCATRIYMKMLRLWIVILRERRRLRLLYKVVTQYKTYWRSILTNVLH